jgi:elongation factor Tu
VLETQELLAAQGYKDAPIVRGSALQALLAIEDGKVDDAACGCIEQLVVALDWFIPNPQRDFESPFLMPIEDVLTIPGRGTVVTGRVQRGVISIGATVEVIGLVDDGGGGDTARKVVVTGIQSFHRDRPEARAGDNVGLLLRGIGRDEVVRGQIVTMPGVVKQFASGEAELYVLGANEGGRHTPFGSGYTPQFFFGATDVTGALEIDGGLVHPGDRARVRFTLIRPVGIEPGMRFALREGGRTIGAGLITGVG